MKYSGKKVKKGVIKSFFVYDAKIKKKKQTNK